MENNIEPAGPLDRDVSRLLVENKELLAHNRKLRYLLFLAHGNEKHYLYGDDGERQCNTCWIDFNSDSPDLIEQKINDFNMRELVKLQAQGK